MSIDRYLNDPIRFGRGALDAFGRQRISNPVTLFDSQSQYNDGNLSWRNLSIGSATASHCARLSCVELEVHPSPNARVIRQTRLYHRYQPGKSQLILTTFVFSPAQAQVVQRVGYYDKFNGIYLELSGSALSLSVRSSTTGSVVNNTIQQAAWNQDTMSDLDISKAQIFYIAIEWLGVGSVECGFVIAGQYRPAHTFLHSNIVSNVYMQTANLPVRYEIYNSATASTTASMQAICCSVISEGGFETNRGFPFSASNGITNKTIGALRKPVISFRPKMTFNSLVNRGQLMLDAIQAYARNSSVFVEVIYDGLLYSASYNSVNALSLAEYDTDATSVSGGIVISSFFVPSSISSPQTPSIPSAQGLGFLSRYPLSLDISGSAATSVTIAATCFSSTASVSVSLGWQEYR